MKKEEFTEILTRTICSVVSTQAEKSINEMLPRLENPSEEVSRKNEEIASLKARLDASDRRVAEAEFGRRRAEEKANSQKWVANELGKFVRDVANGLYEGHEIAAARRVYDLNSGTLAKKRINACNYESLDEARKAYEATVATKTLQFDAGSFLKWLFTHDEA